MRDRILVINPNSTASVTRAIDDAMAPLRIAGRARDRLPDPRGGAAGRRKPD